jgi:hypothetical protein
MIVSKNMLCLIALQAGRSVIFIEFVIISRLNAPAWGLATQISKKTNPQMKHRLQRVLYPYR